MLLRAVKTTTTTKPLAEAGLNNAVDSHRKLDARRLIVHSDKAQRTHRFNEQELADASVFAKTTRRPPKKFGAEPRRLAVSPDHNNPSFPGFTAPDP